MEKTSKWLRSFLTGKKEKGREKGGAPTTALPASKEKRRWSFRRSVGAAKALNSPEPSVSATCHGLLESEIQQKRHAMTVAVATAEAADAAVAAAQAAAEVVRLTVTANSRTVWAIEEASAIKIQSVFRSYLARKALCALKGLVKLQALVRGQLVRKQATAILKCMHSLVNVQARACAQRIGMIEESQATPQWQQNYRRSLQHPQLRQSYEMNRDEEENVKIVEMDSGKTRSNSKRTSSYSMDQTEGTDQRSSIYNSASRTPSKAEMPPEFSPAPSTLIEMSSGARCGHFEEFSFATGQSSPNLSAVSMPTHAPLDYSLCPNYMTNTESSRAKTRSQSAPRQRVDTNERQSCRRRPSVEGRNTPRGIRMQRSSSYVGLEAHSYEYPWSIKLDKSNMSLKGSECDSTSTVLTNTNYCRSLAA